MSKSTSLQPQSFNRAVQNGGLSAINEHKNMSFETTFNKSYVLLHRLKGDNSLENNALLHDLAYAC